MTRVEDLELAVRAADVQPPPGRTPPVGGRSDTGRLLPLARWWARVAPARPEGPLRVEHRWLDADPVFTPPSRATVARFGLDAPDSMAGACDWGSAQADAAADAGTDLVLLSVPDATAAAVLAAHLLQRDPVTALGWPQQAGIDDTTWVDEVAALRDGLRRLRGQYLPDGLVAALGSPAVAAGVGFLLQAGVRRTPVFLDGPGAAVTALATHQVTRRARQWWQVAQSSGSLLHDGTAEKLMLKPLLRLDMHAEDGTAARLALALLEAATAVPVPDPEMLSIVAADEAATVSAVEDSED